MNNPETPANPAQILPAPDVTLTYVILHHSAIPEPHFDLLLQLPGKELLLTWRITTPPANWPITPTASSKDPTAPFAARRIHDHRPLYLTFEGPLSQNRGTIHRLALGTARIPSHTPTTLILYLLTPTPPAPRTLTLPF